MDYRPVGIFDSGMGGLTAVRVLRDGQEQLSTPGDGKLLSAIYAVMGRQTAQEMTPVDGSWDKLSVTGFVTRPAATRGTRGSQIFFVNGRHVRSKLMTAALEQAYRNQLLQGRFPACVLHLHLPEHLVDVNVHPAKTEVRFLREQEVFDCVHYGVLGALEQASGRVQMKLKPQNDGNSAFRTMSAAEYRAAAAALQDGPRPAASRTVLEQIGSLTDKFEPFTFQHLLTQLQFRCTGSTGAIEKWTAVTSIKVKNVATGLKLSLDKTEGAQLTATGTANQTLTVKNCPSEVSLPDAENPSTGYLLLYPTVNWGTEDLPISLEVVATYDESPKTLTVPVNNIEGGVKPGQSHLITLTFTEDGKIAVNTGIAEWQPGNGGSSIVAPF